MAGNYGKFIDRSPIICAAGKVSGDPNDNVLSLFKQYPIDDEIDALKHDARIWKEDQFVPPTNLPPIQNANFKGTNTEVKDILRPAVLTRYQQLISDLKETPYYSYWNAEIGKTRYRVPGLPAGMDCLETTYGQPSKSDISMKELLNPSTRNYEVLKERQAVHEMYKKTHNDYNPSEQVNRGYKKPPYNANKRYGERTKYDPRGIWVECATNWYTREPLAYANKYQADFLKRTRPQIGSILAPNNNIACVPEGYSFGDPSQLDFYGVEDILKDPNIEPSIFKRDFYQWLAALNRTRFFLKGKRAHGFNLEQIYNKLLYLDKEKTGLIPLDELYRLLASNHIVLPKDLEYLSSYLKYVVDGKIDYRKFIDLIDINKGPIELQLIDDIPEESKHYISNYQAACNDYLLAHHYNKDIPAAGVPSIRHDLPCPVAPNGGCKADIENLGDETSAKAVLNPSIYTNYGLTYRDFFLPRSPETLRRLFENVGYKFPDNNFQKLWEMAVKQDPTGVVCVDTFKRLLQIQCPPLRLRVDEKEIECKRGIHN